MADFKILRLNFLPQTTKCLYKLINEIKLNTQLPIAKKLYFVAFILAKYTKIYATEKSNVRVSSDPEDKAFKVS